MPFNFPFCSVYLSRQIGGKYINHFHIFCSKFMEKAENLNYRRSKSIPPFGICWKHESNRFLNFHLKRNFVEKKKFPFKYLYINIWYRVIKLWLIYFIPIIRRIVQKFKLNWMKYRVLGFYFLGIWTLYIHSVFQFFDD